MTEMENNVPDCLVLKFEEIDSDTEQLDQSVYIFYDQSIETYVVRGRRRWTPQIQSCTYSYECDNESDLADFLEYLFCPDNNVNEICKEFVDRSIIGYNKYKVTTERTDLDFDQWIQHLKEELMDAVVYIHRTQKEREKDYDDGK